MSLLHPIKVATDSIYSQVLPIVLHTSSNTGRRVKHYCSEGRPLLLRAWSNSACTSDLYSFALLPPRRQQTFQGGSRPTLRGKDLALSKIIATFAEQKDILLPANAQAGL